jgi:hypothetical protein
MPIRIQLFTLMRIRIQVSKIMRVHPDPDIDPQPWNIQTVQKQKKMSPIPVVPTVKDVEPAIQQNG